MKGTKNEIRGWWKRIVRAVVAVLLLSAGVQAGYKPVDISDIKGEDRKELEKVAKAIAGFPSIARDAFLSEQLGLYFQNDGSQAMSHIAAVGNKGYHERHYAFNACFVTRGGKIIRKEEGRAYIPKSKQDEWHKTWCSWMEFHTDPALSFYEKDVEKLTLSTAKYLLKTMPREHRWFTLALMGKMAYNDQGAFDWERVDSRMENGLITKTPRDECRGYLFLGPEGKEYDIRALIDADNKDWRWRQIVWRCENLVGSKDILALFPKEVEAMRKHFKERIAKVKDEAKAKNDALLAGADEAVSSLPKEKRLARIALAMGLYYLDHKDAGYADGHLNPNATIILPDGTKHSGEEFVGESPGLLQQIPHEAILEYYRQPIEQMARAVAKERFGKMPASVRDLLRAQLSRQLTKLNGTLAKTEEGVSTIQTFDRAWQVPTDAVDHQNTYFKNSEGSNISYSIIDKYQWDYEQTLRLVNLCARILGKEETADLIPSGDVATENETAREGTSMPRDKLLAQGQTALREMPAEQRRAWLAEKMGFCFTEDGEPAYQSERTANENAVYVDAQGEVCKLADVSAKDSTEWTAATNAARIVGYDQLTVPYKEEIRRLAVQTSKCILTSMPPELRQSRLAEDNKLLFMPNAQVSYSLQEATLESGIKVSHQGVGPGLYRKCMYYNPNGKIVPTTALEGVRQKRWLLLSHCEAVAGIEAISAQFPAEVEPMRAAYKKSPFYKK